MIKRTIDISQPAYIHVKSRQLIIEHQRTEIGRCSIEDLGILILQHPQTTISLSAVSMCQQNNVAIVFCDHRHLPVSVLLPLWEGNSLHSKIQKQQLKSTVPVRKRLWQQIVKQKIAEQMYTLQQVGCKVTSLQRLVNKVRSGDPDNCEAQAACYYWKSLMGKDFRRDPDDDGVNSLLNYGYAIMRAMIARALVGSGLDPTLGLHHKNQYNSFCLADDVMEPFRSWVDFKVVEHTRELGHTEIDKSAKQCLLGMLAEDVIYQGRKMPLMVASHSITSVLKQAISGEVKDLVYPKRITE